MPVPAPADPRGLPGWPGTGPDLALHAYLGTRDLLGPGSPAPAPGEGAAAFFDRAFAPAPAQEGLLTGYFEPELDASPVETSRFRHPLHAPPEGLPPLWLTRREIVARGGAGLRALAWLDDPLEAFVVHVQGSVRLRLQDGRAMRLGFAARNGHPYRSIGAELVARGAIAAAALSLDAIRAWAAAHPADLPELLCANPSYVFFRPLDPAGGPIGTAGWPVAAGHALAVDPAHVALGTPVWLAAPGLPPRLCVAQDTGSAILGPGRADLFCGSGAAAGAVAGALRTAARLWPLVPRSAA